MHKTHIHLSLAANKVGLFLLDLSLCSPRETDFDYEHHPHSFLEHLEMSLSEIVVI